MIARPRTLSDVMEGEGSCSLGPSLLHFSVDGDGFRVGRSVQDGNGNTPVRGSDGPPSRKPGQYQEKTA